MKKTKAKKPAGRFSGFTEHLSTGSGPVFIVRRAANFSQKKLAERIGCSVTTVRRCEAEGRLPKSRAVHKELHDMAEAHDLLTGG